MSSGETGTQDSEVTPGTLLIKSGTGTQIKNYKKRPDFFYNDDMAYKSLTS